MINHQKNILKKYQRKRNDTPSVFGISIEFDWIILLMVTFVIFLVVFYWSFNSFERVKNFVPENQEEEFLLEDKRINERLDKVISNLEKNI